MTIKKYCSQIKTEPQLKLTHAGSNCTFVIVSAIKKENVHVKWVDMLHTAYHHPTDDHSAFRPGFETDTQVIFKQTAYLKSSSLEPACSLVFISESALFELLEGFVTVDRRSLL